MYTTYYVHLALSRANHVIMGNLCRSWLIPEETDSSSLSSHGSPVALHLGVRLCGLSLPFHTGMSTVVVIMYIIEISWVHFPCHI